MAMAVGSPPKNRPLSPSKTERASILTPDSKVNGVDMTAIPIMPIRKPATSCAGEKGDRLFLGPTVSSTSTNASKNARFCSNIKTEPIKKAPYYSTALGNKPERAGGKIAKSNPKELLEESGRFFIIFQLSAYSYALSISARRNCTSTTADISSTMPPSWSLKKQMIAGKDGYRAKADSFLL